MKFLCSTYNWFKSGTSGISGGEIYLQNLIKYLRTQGHEFRIIHGGASEYTHEDILCIPQGEGMNLFTGNQEHVQWCDAIMCQLIGTAYGYNKAISNNKPIIWIAHNNSTAYPIRYAQSCNVIYNSYQLREDLHNTFGHFNTTVCHPVITQYPESNGECVTLVNCSVNKGGHILGKIAERLPQYKFIGILGGYQEQIQCDLPNVTYLPNGTDMADVYAQTRILIVPSEFESYSQVAAEALTAGISVIAHPTPGLKENLAYAGTFVDRNNINGWVSAIINSHKSELPKQRANSCNEMNKQELVNLNKWLLDIVK